MVDFETLPNDEYIKWINRAEFLQEKGYFSDTPVLELAELLYNKSACEG